MTGDKLVGEVSRLVVAEACIQALDIEFTQGKAYEINSVKVITEASDQKHVLMGVLKNQSFSLIIKHILFFFLWVVVSGRWSRK